MAPCSSTCSPVRIDAWEGVVELQEAQALVNTTASSPSRSRKGVKSPPKASARVVSRVTSTMFGRRLAGGSPSTWGAPHSTRSSTGRSASPATRPTSSGSARRWWPATKRSSSESPA